MKLWVFWECCENGQSYLFFCYAKQYNEFIKIQNIDNIIRLKLIWVKEGLFETLQYQSTKDIREYIEPILKQWAILHGN